MIKPCARRILRSIHLGGPRRSTGASRPERALLLRIRMRGCFRKNVSPFPLSAYVAHFSSLKSGPFPALNHLPDARGSLRFFAIPERGCRPGNQTLLANHHITGLKVEKRINASWAVLPSLPWQGSPYSENKICPPNIAKAHYMPFAVSARIRSPVQRRTGGQAGPGLTL